MTQGANDEEATTKDTKRTKGYRRHQHYDRRNLFL